MKTGICILNLTARRLTIDFKNRYVLQICKYRPIKRLKHLLLQVKFYLSRQSRRCEKPTNDATSSWPNRKFLLMTSDRDDPPPESLKDDVTGKFMHLRVMGCWLKWLSI